VLIASSSELWHADESSNQRDGPSLISGEAGLTKSPVLFFLIQANRIQAGKSSVMFY
jgi:hypothetical protein